MLSCPSSKKRHDTARPSFCELQSNGAKVGAGRASAACIDEMQAALKSWGPPDSTGWLTAESDWLRRSDRSELRDHLLRAVFLFRRIVTLARPAF